MIKTAVAVWATFCIFASLPAHGATIHVPGDYPGIQLAINASVDGDIVLVAPGTYVENIYFLGKAITLTSSDGPEATVIDGDYRFSVVSFVHGEDENSVIEGLTLTRGFAKGQYGRGGGIYCENASPVIRNNVITGNHASSGAGIAFDCESSPTVTGNVISANGAQGEGGGLLCGNAAGSHGIVTGNVISGNAAPGGGGLSARPWTIVTGNTIFGNHATAVGGGIYCNGDGTTVSDNSITDNWALASGGGIYCGYGAPVISGNLIAGNWCTDGDGGGVSAIESSPNILGNIISGNSAFWGGGLYLHSSSATLASNVIAGNSASDLGGGILCLYFAPEILNNTVTGNSADWGGGIACGGALGTIVNTIIWDNEAATGPELYLFAGGDPAVSHCDVEGGWPGQGNIDANPLLAGAGAGDFHLSWTSPCRDSGDSGGVPPDLVEDFEGDPRIALGAADIGADEYYYHLYATGDVIPGATIEIKTVAYPSAPIALFLGAKIQDPPLPTQYGDFWIEWPPVWYGGIGAAPESGILVLPAAVPQDWPSGSEHPLQALVGPWAGPFTKLTNLHVLEVR